MTRLTERDVQDKSLVFLEEYYRNKYQLQQIFVKDEVRTKIKKGNFGRADGLLCFHSIKQRNHLVSLEAKSHKTLGALRPHWNNTKLWKHLLLAFLIGSFASLFFSLGLNRYWVMTISLLWGSLLSFVYFCFAYYIEPNHLKVTGVVDQLKGYPANEQWISISKDSLNLTVKQSSEFNAKSNDQNLILICKRNGIGLLIVSNNKVGFILEPTFKKGEFVSNYAIEDAIQKQISA